MLHPPWDVDMMAGTPAAMLRIQFNMHKNHVCTRKLTVAFLVIAKDCN